MSCRRPGSKLGRVSQESLFHRTSEVFVAGKQPTITYNPRDERHLEQEVKGYLDQPGKALSVSGPTKSGKTVLIERLLPRGYAIWIQGSDLEGVSKFWQSVAEGLDVYDQVAATAEASAGTGSNRRPASAYRTPATSP